jgi:hypothetical protein
VTFDDAENVPDDILSALKADGRVAAPAGARGRVLSRLGVGVAAAGAAVALPTSVSAAVGKATGTSITPVAGSAFGLGLVKALALHPILSAFATLAVGSSVGLGAYTVLEPSRAPAPVVNVEVAQSPEPIPMEARAVPTPEPAAPPAAPAAAPRAARPAAPTAAPSPLPTATPATDESTADQAVVPSPVEPVARTAQNPEPALVPAPDLPSSRPRLAEQQALLDQARAALRRGDGAGALAIVTGHERLHPVTTFAEERDAIGILALVMVGRADDAWPRAEAFARRHPTSLFLPAIQRSLQPPGGKPGTTQPPK